MSDTPRTDAMRGFAISHYGSSKSYDLVCDEGGPFVHADFARQLERELNTERQCAEKAEEDLAEARKRCDEMLSALRENEISAAVIAAENKRVGHVYAIERDCKFIADRAAAAREAGKGQP